jgi:hypothetical protein
MAVATAYTAEKAGEFPLLLDTQATSGECGRKYGWRRCLSGTPLALNLSNGNIQAKNLHRNFSTGKMMFVF